MKRLIKFAVAAVVAVLMFAVAGCAQHVHVYTDGVCSECGYACEHTVYENELCAECGEPCPHTTYEQGVCKECGRVCSHTYVGGVCEVWVMQKVQKVDNTEFIFLKSIVKSLDFIRLILYTVNAGCVLLTKVANC